jgi:hypothetical protein
MNPKECCPRFDPKPWDDQIHVWKDKHFIQDKVFTFFYIPLNFGAVITRLMKKVESAGAKSPDNLCLSDHPSRWKMNICLAVDKEIAGANNMVLSGKFFSKVYEGNFKEIGKWCKEFSEAAKAKGLTVKKQYMWYTTCPKCAKKYGKNYVVILGEI